MSPLSADMPLSSQQDAVCTKAVPVCKGVTVNPPSIEKPKMKNGGPGIKTPDDVDKASTPPPPPSKKKKGKKKPKPDL